MVAGWRQMRNGMPFRAICSNRNRCHFNRPNNRNACTLVSSRKPNINQQERLAFPKPLEAFKPIILGKRVRGSSAMKRCINEPGGTHLVALLLLATHPGGPRDMFSTYPARTIRLQMPLAGIIGRATNGRHQAKFANI